MAGKVHVTLYIDEPRRIPRPGMFLVTVGVRGVGSIYLITRSRRITRRDPAAGPRFSLRCQRGFSRADLRGNAYVCMRWYPRAPRRPVF
jgi:hypothetical protein